MVHTGSKGYYVNLLKEKNIRYIEGRKLETFKTHYLANYYFRLLEREQ